MAEKMNAHDIAMWFCSEYRQKHGILMDEMKLHKLMYLAQRESLIRSGNPLFDEAFSAWKYGPVLVGIRSEYAKGAFDVPTDFDDRLPDDVTQTLRFVFESYADKNSWSLSRLTHSEYSWIHAREGLSPDEHGDTLLTLDDIKVDANRVANRRRVIAELNAFC